MVPVSTADSSPRALGAKPAPYRSFPSTCPAMMFFWISRVPS